MAVKVGTQHMAGSETRCVQCRSLFLEVMCWMVGGVKGGGGGWCGLCWRQNECCKRKYLILCAWKLLIIQPNKANTVSDFFKFIISGRGRHSFQPPQATKDLATPLKSCWWMFWCYNIVALTVKFMYAQSLLLFSAIIIIVKQKHGAVYLRHHDLLNGPFEDRPF